MIRVKKSPTADTRTCDWSKVTKVDLLRASNEHINDVKRGLLAFAQEIIDRGNDHDHTKISAIDQFHADFTTGFKTQAWYDMHKRVERHHLSSDDGVRDDVDLIDVLEHIADCVMAGMARSGQVRPLDLSDDVLRKAFENTWKKLAANVEVIE